jgi:hypothetical protein
MGIADTLKKLFSGGGSSRDEEAVEQQEFGRSDRGVEELRGQEPDFERLPAENVADALEDDFKAPPDPNP